MATCKRRTKEDRWASSLRHISNFESTVRRNVGYTCFIASILVAEYFRRYSEWRVVTTEYPSLFSNDMLQIPTTSTFFRSSVLMSLSGAGVMLYAMGELSQWGCIVTLRWNPDGEGKRSYPEHLKKFGRLKRCEFFQTYLLCAWIGWGFGLGLCYYSTNYDSKVGDSSFVIFQCCYMILVMVIALVGMLFA